MFSCCKVDIQAISIETHFAGMFLKTNICNFRTVQLLLYTYIYTYIFFNSVYLYVSTYSILTAVTEAKKKNVICYVQGSCSPAPGRRSWGTWPPSATPTSQVDIRQGSLVSQWTFMAVLVSALLLLYILTLSMALNYSRYMR
jgi:hypothetical protein